MYTNIDTATGIQSVKEFIQCNQDYIPTDFPSSLFLQVLKIVMENNIFSFENTTWLQLSGTAMGTPVACAYSSISYGQHKNSKILPNFGDNYYITDSTSMIFSGFGSPQSLNPKTNGKNLRRHSTTGAVLNGSLENPPKQQSS
jgi:hypothetical protein